MGGCLWCFLRVYLRTLCLTAEKILWYPFSLQFPSGVTCAISSTSAQTCVLFWHDDMTILAWQYSSIVSSQAIAYTVNTNPGSLNLMLQLLMHLTWKQVPLISVYLISNLCILWISAQIWKLYRNLTWIQITLTCIPVKPVGPTSESDFF